ASGEVFQAADAPDPARPEPATTGIAACGEVFQTFDGPAASRPALAETGISGCGEVFQAPDAPAASQPAPAKSGISPFLKIFLPSAAPAASPEAGSFSDWPDWSQAEESPGPADSPAPDPAAFQALAEEISRTQSLALASMDKMDKVEKALDSNQRRLRRWDQGLEYLIQNQEALSRRFAPAEGSCRDRILDFGDQLILYLAENGSNPHLAVLRKKYAQILAEMDLSLIDEVNVPFNPEIHSACCSESRPDLPPDLIMSLIQPGYLFGQEVLRPALVVVNRPVRLRPAGPPEKPAGRLRRRIGFSRHRTGSFRPAGLYAGLPAAASKPLDRRRRKLKGKG
ncbi:MAG: nucleotide exchange factor GrpE, partial [Deltaproteobacteria bacterium]|nr:nucleotide exchange factor GrpE [Deltaproteobacteria bacterium]